MTSDAAIDPIWPQTGKDLPSPHWCAGWWASSSSTTCSVRWRSSSVRWRGAANRGASLKGMAVAGVILGIVDLLVFGVVLASVTIHGGHAYWHVG